MWWHDQPFFVSYIYGIEIMSHLCHPTYLENWPNHRLPCGQKVVAVLLQKTLAYLVTPNVVTTVTFVDLPPPQF